MTTTSIQYGCPHCRSAKLYVQKVAFVEYEVKAFAHDGTVEVLGKPEIQKGSERHVPAENQFRCGGCGARFQDPEPLNV